MSQSESLKPCPFCGGEPERLELTDEDNFGGSVISCKKCGASSPVHFDRKENLDDSWNRRPSTADRGGEVEVKALEWSDSEGGYAIADTPFGLTYWAHYNGWELDVGERQYCADIEAAKAAAQADYTARIRSALATTAGESPASGNGG